MARMRWLVAGGAILLGLGAGSLTLSAAAPEAPVGPWGTLRSETGHARRLPRAGEDSTSVLERATHVTFVDPGDDGEGAGDHVVFRSELIHEGSGEKVGADNIECTLFFARRLLCHGVFVLAGRGQVTVEGVIGERSSSISLAVTGGTGEFRNARGRVVVQSIDDGTNRITFDLTS